MSLRSSGAITSRMAKIGFLVNPVSGMGWRVGLKGTDGAGILARARKLGAVPEASSRARRALRPLAPIQGKFEIFTASGSMGENDLRKINFSPENVFPTPIKNTNAKDTIDATRYFVEKGVELILFAGGDGTARNILQAVGDRVSILGIPTGVKMHSGVFAISPEAAGRLVSYYSCSNRRLLRYTNAEVMDIDEDAQRDNRLSAKLFGIARVPVVKNLIQNAKSAARLSETACLQATASEFIQEMDDTSTYIVGPGTTTQLLFKHLDLTGTLMGVDVIQCGKILCRDANEVELLSIVKNNPAKIVLGVVGGQGFVLGRGNQQISAPVIEQVGTRNIVVISSIEKLLGLPRNRILVDTGSSKLDAMLSGFTPVRTAPRTTTMTRVDAA